MNTLDDLFAQVTDFVKHATDEVNKQTKAEENIAKAKEVFEIYSSFISVGFTEEQAWELLITLIKNV